MIKGFPDYLSKGTVLIKSFSLLLSLSSLVSSSLLFIVTTTTPSLVLSGVVPQNRTTHQTSFFVIFPESSFQKDWRRVGGQSVERKSVISLRIFGLKNMGFRPVSLILRRGSFVRYFTFLQWEKEEGNSQIKVSP